MLQQIEPHKYYIILVLTKYYVYHSNVCIGGYGDSQDTTTPSRVKDG